MRASTAACGVCRVVIYAVLFIPVVQSNVVSCSGVCYPSKLVSYDSRRLENRASAIKGTYRLGFRAVKRNRKTTTGCRNPCLHFGGGLQDLWAQPSRRMCIQLLSGTSSEESPAC
ncbi:hypothetical protein BU16DRAFT_98562 [Lophium mytilinum]|uniref:Secreted protein n=1 Tax=Lophium mytilinum TaxID=390894 RepID=A0A6A6QJS8_9PEZI|nr:hypothetical protein BU16DRAFT_98562 [Lophium mytilinum]